MPLFVWANGEKARLLLVNLVLKSKTMAVFFEAGRLCACRYRDGVDAHVFDSGVTTRGVLHLAVRIISKVVGPKTMVYFGECLPLLRPVSLEHCVCVF